MHEANDRREIFDKERRSTMVNGKSEMLPSDPFEIAKILKERRAKRRPPWQRPVWRPRRRSAGSNVVHRIGSPSNAGQSHRLGLCVAVGRSIRSAC